MSAVRTEHRPDGVAVLTLDQPGGKVNINSATESDFENLPGIGPVLAQKIVDYRDQHGPFRSIQDLMKVSGIGQKKFDSLQAYVTV